MTCPKCHAEFESGARACPECGLQLVRNISGVMKTSTILIATRGERNFYRSVQEVPEPLRSRLIASTHSANSGTIVIADRAGKDQITQVIARRENARVDHSGRKNQSAEGLSSPPWHAFFSFSFLGFRMIAWAGLLLFVLAMAVILSVFTIHW